MRKLFVQIALLSSGISCGTMVVGASGSSYYSVQMAPGPSLDGIVLTQAQRNISTNQATSADDDLADEIDLELSEELLLQFLADPSAFIANPDNADIIAAVVRQVIMRDFSNVDVVIAAVEGQAEARIASAVADGIARAAADYAAAGDAAASSQILAKASISSSTALREAVQTKVSEIATEIATVRESLQNEEVVLPEEETQVDTPEREIVQETEATLSDGETLLEPVSDAPLLGATTPATGDGDVGAVPSSGTSQRSPTSPTNIPAAVTPPPVGDPASPA